MENEEVLVDLKKPLRILPFLKVLLFLGVVLFLVAPFQLDWKQTTCFLLAALCLVLYLWLHKRDDFLLRKKKYHLALKKVYHNELSFLRGDYTSFDNGERFIDQKHPFAFDLDLFGENSIYHMINRTVTPLAGTILARMLGFIPSTKDEIDKRQKSIAELANKEDFRHRFMAICQGFIEGKDDLKALKAIEGVGGRPRMLTSTAGLVLIYCSIGVTLSAGVLAYLGIVPWSLFIVLFMLQFIFPMLFNSVSSRVGADLGFLHKNTRVHADLLKILKEEVFETGLNGDLKNELFDTHNAHDALRDLSRLLKKYDQRHNAYILVLFNGLFLRDLFLLRQFYRWKDQYASHIEPWIILLAEMEARVSQATFVFNRPGYTRPVIEEDASVLIEAKGMGHPFIPDAERVDNDIRIQRKKFMIVTGANMAGKSTFLRTVGVNYVLAVNGMNVCATSFHFSLFQLFSSMRNTDDLSSGTSYFKAELERMRELIRFCQTHDHTLIILDELLKGTNSRDKLNGSILFLKKMGELPVTGIIATHDLELAKLADETPARYQNWCFEINLSGEDQFTYKIQPGVSKNMNATFLLEQILLQELE